MSNEKHVDGTANGRYDIYSNGLGTNKAGDGFAHDHIFANVNKNGDVTNSGMVDRSDQRDKVIRGLGGAALR
ncbi:hypothetical protein HQQ82_09270 [Rathayibacter sp. VKM Ac-2856]|uniref:hypothetical protein n=1 Tax=unclassified Rathayibacter TaxID=2609250 RepID=UPI0015675BF6|nr:MULTISPECIES: hypothetical protein [unclassified Rathayibacter]NQX04988.1 hypothetical protein [Rathayibacter sp. VKM Ac-2858]NQX20156.1 hypothetical protein [Rathayibacter sp. VKM Ac-2856]